MHMDQCIFCRIIRKEIPNYTVYEDDDVLAFLDIEPRAKGHTMVIPKEHAETALLATDESLSAVAKGIRRVMQRLTDVLAPHGFTVGWNHGAAGGQVVPHLHVHVIPRWEGDGGGNIHSVISNPGSQTVEYIASLF